MHDADFKLALRPVLGGGLRPGRDHAREFGIWNLEFIKTLDAKEPRALLI